MISSLINSSIDVLILSASFSITWLFVVVGTCSVLLQLFESMNDYWKLNNEYREVATELRNLKESLKENK